MPASRRSTPDPGPARRKRTPATTPDGRESKLISLAERLAEQQLQDGTASSQVITHYLKLGSSRERLEQSRLEGEVRLQEAKINAMASNERAEEMFTRAMNAFRGYRGESADEDPEDYDDYL